MKFFGIWALLLAACSSQEGGEAQSQRSSRSRQEQTAEAAAKGNVGPSSEVAGKTVANSDPLALASALKDRENQLMAERKELDKLKLVNDSLCQRLAQIRKECIAKTPITSNAYVRQMSCEGDIKRVAVNTKVELDLYTNGQGTFKLKLNNSFISEVLSSGISELKFTGLADDKDGTPTFDTIKRIDLVPVTLTPPSGQKEVTVTLELLIDGRPLLKDTLVGVAKVGENYPVRIFEIYQNIISSSCQMSPEDMDALMDDINKHVDPSSSELAVKSEKTAGTKASLAKMQKQLEALEAELSQLNPQLESARNRSFKLKNELLGGSGVGCHLKQDLASLTITIEGSKTTEDVSTKVKNKKEGHGEPSTLDIDLGGVSYATKNFIGTIIPDQDYSNMKLGSIDRLVLTKLGVKYNNLKNRCTSGAEGFLNDLANGNECYDIFEEEVMSINSIQIEANGITIFKKGSLGIILNRNRLSWSFDELQGTPEWSQMLQRSDCDVSQ